MRTFSAVVVLALVAASLFIFGPDPASAAVVGGRLAVTPVTGPGVVIASAGGRDAHRVCIPTESKCERAQDVHWSTDGRQFVFSEPCHTAGCTPEVIAGTTDAACSNCEYDVQGGYEGYATPMGSGTDATLQGARGLTNTVLFGRLISSTVTGQRVATLAGGGVTAGTVSRRGTIAVVRRGIIWIGDRGHLRRIGRGGDPAWSPSGDGLAFQRQNRIELTGSTGHKIRVLTSGSSPSWSPNGREIAYLGAQHRVMEISLATRHSHPVENLRGRSVAWGTTPGPAKCLAPVGSHRISTNAGTTVDETWVPGHGKTLIGCTGTDGVARVLTSLNVPNEDSAYYLKQTVTDGSYAGFVISFVDVHYSGYFNYVAVYDLRIGREPSGLGGEGATGSLDDLVLNASGDTAVHAFGAPTDLESLLASSGTGVQTIVTAPANSTNTTLADLSLTGTTLSFTNNGVPQTATLP